MPTNRKHRGYQRRQQVDILSYFQEVELFHGKAMALNFQFESTERMRDAWELHRDTLREKWAETHAPGTRCFAEWLFEIIPQYGERPITADGSALLPYRKNWEKHGVLHTHLRPEAQEPEHVFLFRHGIIDQAEFDAAEELHHEWVALHRRCLDPINPK